MFFASLFLAGIQLLGGAVVFGVARRQRVAGLFFGFLGGLFALLVVPSALRLFSVVAFFQAIALVAIGIACSCLKTRQVTFLGWAVAATAILFGWWGWSAQKAWSGLKERYPFESMAGRLAYESKAVERGDSVPLTTQLSAMPLLPEATLERLDQAEQYRRWSWIRRSDSLRVVHASYVEQFTEGPGFGVSRMPRPSPYSIEVGEERERTLHQLDRRPDLDGSPEPGTAGSASHEGPRLAASLVTGTIGELHDQARQDFLNSDVFGYVRDRDHVAGFIPHAFLDRLPTFRPEGSPQRWLTVRVELMSLLKHDRPMVYVSDHLPNMTELRESPIRDLDDFERRALQSLIEGDDLVSDVQLGRIRALGSLRAMRQCLECHEVQRGALLGAFSYEFLRDLPPQRQPKQRPTAEGEKLL